MRGLHHQVRLAQGKLFRTIVDSVYDVVIDFRCSSPTYCCRFGLVLSAENKKELWIPPGFAHGFYTLTDWVEVCYQATNYYAPQGERTILWNDPDLAITWPLLDGRSLLVSTKDAQDKLLKAAEPCLFMRVLSNLQVMVGTAFI